MRVILCQWRFEQPIQLGIKRSTIRRNARCVPGQTLSLRRWQGKPYRSKQILLKEVECTAVTPISLGLNDRGDFYVIRNGCSLTTSQVEALAKLEGFDSAADLSDWFRHNHQLQPGNDSIQCDQIEW
jgi:hypothetical protein